MATATRHTRSNVRTPRPVRASGPAPETLFVVPANGAMTEEPAALEDAVMVRLEQITPNPEQPRRTFDQAELQELANDIARRGLLQPILIRRKPLRADGSSDGYDLVAGERRWRAAKLAGLTHIPAVIKDMSKMEALDAAWAENAQRANLLPMEEAWVVRGIMTELGLSRRAAAKHFNKDKGYIDNLLVLLGMGEDVQQMVDTRPDSKVAARYVDRVKDPVERKRLIERVKSGVNVQKIKSEVEQLLSHFNGSNGLPAAGFEDGEQQVFGGARSGLPVVPRLDIALALDTAARELQAALHEMRGMTLVRRDYHNRIAPRIEKLDGLLADIKKAAEPAPRGKR